MKNLVNILKSLSEKDIKNYKIKEVFYQNGEVYITSYYELPKDLYDKIENEVLFSKIKSKSVSGIGSTIYSADQVVGKSLYMNAGKSINIRKLPTITSDIITMANGGDYVGDVYSYVVKSDGIWWMLDRGNVTCFVKHAEGYFDVKALASQGALTPEEIEARKQEAEKTFGDKVLDKVSSLLKYGIIAFVAVTAIGAFLKK